jgi:hypothetical protein
MSMQKIIYPNHLEYWPLEKVKVPPVINLGSGKDWRSDCLNVDILPNVYPDICLDICSDLAWGIDINTVRFNTFKLQKNYFEEITANDVLEHLPNLAKAMRTCLDLLRVGGKFHISVPYDLSYGAWQDPTHVRAFNERSWLYYSDWHWYLGWQDFKFSVEKLDFVLSDYGQQLQSKNFDADSIIKSPRAVDSMSVILVKTTV